MAPVPESKGQLDATDPSTAPSTLNLTGRLLLATASIPYKAAFVKGKGDWELKPRQGNSALFSSFHYLAAETKWKTILIGWPGEIKATTEKGNPSQEHMEQDGAAATAPIDVVNADNFEDHQEEQDTLVSLTKENRASLETILGKGDLYGGLKIVPVWMVGEEDGDVESGDITLKDQSRWTMYAQKEIWPILHYLQQEPTDGRKERSWWKDYVKFNQAYAEKILAIYQPGDVVWIHDYHLLLLPSMLRQKLAKIYVASFVHAPFPSSELYRSMGKRKEILEGMLGANMIGFQSIAYARHFVSSCTRVLGFESNAAGVDAYGAHVAVDAFPIGIDAAKVEAESEGSSIQEKMTALRDISAGKKIIVGRDRLDAVRGVVQKLRGFEMFLEDYPEWRDKVVLIQVSSPSTSSGPKVEQQVSELVSHINGTYGSLHFSPVQHYPQYLSQDEYYALLKVADLGLITSVRDGMNTTSLEYVICQKENHSPVIISEFTGTASSLNAAVQVNPWDTKGIAEAINKCLSMSDAERKELANAAYEHVTTNTIQNWSRNFLQTLLTNLSSYDQSEATPPLNRELLKEQYNKAKRRLFMFDYDGTLTPIVKDPNRATPTDRVIRTIKKLASDPANNVWIVSGRDQAFLEQWMGDISELGLSAEHGSFVRQPKSSDWINLTEEFDMGWQKDVIDIFQYYTERTQGSFIERKKCALTWHYRRADPEYGAFQARECQAHLENTVSQRYEVEVMTGKANLEVRPTFVNKGEIAKRLVAEYGDEEPPEFVLCLGDDTTDEDMFRSLRRTTLPPEHIFAVTVGAASKMTLATWHLLEPHDVINALALLVGVEELDEKERPSGQQEAEGSVNTSAAADTAVISAKGDAVGKAEVQGKSVGDGEGIEGGVKLDS